MKGKGELRRTRMAAQARMQSTFSCPIDISKSERERES